MIEKKIGKQIQRYRKKKGLTQDEFSEMIGVTSHHLSSYERGLYNIKLEVLVQMMNILDCSADDLFCDVVNKSASARASRLSEELDGLPPEEREKILDVVETMIKNAK